MGRVTSLLLRLTTRTGNHSALNPCVHGLHHHHQKEEGEQESRVCGDQCVILLDNGPLKGCCPCNNNCAGAIQASEQSKQVSLKPPHTQRHVMSALHSPTCCCREHRMRLKSLGPA